MFLGYRRYLVSGEDGTAEFVLDPGTELGIMREDDESRFRSSVPLEELSPARRKLLEGPPLVIGKIAPSRTYIGGARWTVSRFAA